MLTEITGRLSHIDVVTRGEFDLSCMMVELYIYATYNVRVLSSFVEKGSIQIPEWDLRYVAEAPVQPAAMSPRVREAPESLVPSNKW